MIIYSPTAAPLTETALQLTRGIMGILNPGEVVVTFGHEIRCIKPGVFSVMFALEWESGINKAR